MNNYKDWIGKKISRSDIITPRLVDHLKKTIDLNCLSDQTVPEGIFLCLCPDVASINDLDKDGNTKLGIFLPELPYKIRMWAGGKIKIFDEFEIGSEIKKNSTISSIEFKEGRSGNLYFVNINNLFLFKYSWLILTKHRLPDLPSLNSILEMVECFLISDPISNSSNIFILPPAHILIL